MLPSQPNEPLPQKSWLPVKGGKDEAIRSGTRLDSSGVERGPDTTTPSQHAAETSPPLLRKASDGQAFQGGELGRAWINDEQYFDNVPKAAWEFYIGGYQPAQKWLKDRKGRELSIEDLRHYQKIIVALTETGRIMGEIDGVVIV